MNKENKEKYDSLILDNHGNNLGKSFEFENFHFRVYINYLQISIQDGTLPKVTSQLCSSKKNVLARVYEGRTDILGFGIEIKKIDGATFFIIDNQGFSNSNKNPDFFGGILQESFESTEEYMTRHNIPNSENHWWEFLNINGVEKLVNMNTQLELALIDERLHLGIRQKSLDLFSKWVEDEFGKQTQAWFNKWGNGLILVVNAEN